MNRMDASRPPLMPNVITPQGLGPLNCFTTSAWSGESGRPAKLTHATFSCARSHVAILSALSAWRRMRTWSDSRPMFSRKALNGEGIAP